MTPRHHRVILGSVAVAALSAAILGGVGIARRATVEARQDLLRAETATAAEMVRMARSGVVLRPVFGNRWAFDPVDDPAVDQAVADWIDGHLEGRAALYDSDGWFRRGTLHLGEPSDRAPRWRLPLVAALLAACLTVPIVTSWIRDRRRWPAALAGVVVVGTALAVADRHTHAVLDGLTDARMDQAVRALVIIGPEAASRHPGGVYQLTGIPFLILPTSGEVAFSTLPPAATESLAAAPRAARAWVRADGVRYAVADVGAVRLALLPLIHAHEPLATLGALGLAALTIAGLATSLARRAAQPREFRRIGVAWAFLAPSMVHLVVFTVGPLLFAAWLSLHRWSLIDVARPFVGLANYVRVLTDPGWWNAVQNTAVFTLHVPVSMAAALGLALIVQRRGPGIIFLRALFFLPTITSLVAIAIAWQWIFHDEFGLLNWILSLVGVGRVRWLTSPDTALLAIMLMSVWLVVGYQMVLFQAGLATIPRDLYEAARIDGAGPWRRFLHVTLPGLRHTLFFVLVTSVIGSFQIFGAVYVMTEGGPLHATDVAVFHIYEEAWEFFRFGDAAAMSWILFAIVFAVTWLQFRVLERRVEER